MYVHSGFAVVGIPVVLLFANPIFAIDNNITSSASKDLYEHWSNAQISFDAGDYRSAIAMTKKTIELAETLQHSDLKRETELFLRDLRRFDALSGDMRDVIDEVIKLRSQANKPVPKSKTALLFQKAIERYQTIKEGPNDFTLVALECDYLIAAFQCSDSAGRDSTELAACVKTLERRCINSFGRKSFLYTAVLAAKRGLLIRNKQWGEAADNAGVAASIFAELFPESFYHVKTLEAWTGSLGMAKRPKEAVPIIELACAYVEKKDAYKYSDLGVTAYLQSGEIALLEGRIEDAEGAFKKAQKIVDALREGVISRKLIETLDQYHIECLIRLGREADADALKQRSSTRF